jgi:hypothetical protein
VPSRYGLYTFRAIREKRISEDMERRSNNENDFREGIAGINGRRDGRSD